MEGAATKVLARVCLEIRLVMVQLAKRRKLEKHKLGKGRAFWGMLCHLWTPSFFTGASPSQASQWEKRSGLDPLAEQINADYCKCKPSAS